MPTSSKLLILCFIMAFVAIQAQAFPGAAAPTAASTAAVPTTTFNKGTVIETMNASGYTYLHLENNGQDRWAAIPETQVKVGDQVELGAAMEMYNFQSKSLGRTFETIIFSQGLVKQ
jgi:hypothetical protein